MARRYPYMDLERVGIDGASGGGYAAARAILTHAQFYKVAVAAEGNHDLRGYCASWGEIYQGPMLESGYQGISNLPLVGNLKGKLLLMHGEIDDNVHPALTMKLVDALITANKASSSSSTHESIDRAARLTELIGQSAQVTAGL